MKWMKRWKGCKVCILLAVGWLVLSAVGYMEKDDVYAGYTVDTRTTPYFELVFAGLHDGIYPWSAPQKQTVASEAETAGQGAQPGSASDQTVEAAGQPGEGGNGGHSRRTAETEGIRGGGRRLFCGRPVYRGFPNGGPAGLRAYGQCLFLCIGGADCVRHVG